MNNRINTAIRETLNLGESTTITPETTLQGDLGADSIDRIELVVNLEREFDIDLEDEDIERCQTVADVYRVVSSALGEEPEAQEQGKEGE